MTLEYDSMLEFCPRCHVPAKGSFVVRRVQGVQIDQCTRCGGTWFDPTEYEQLLERDVEEARAKLKEIDGETEPRKEASTSVRRECPHCNAGRLEPVHVLFDDLSTSVLIDRCSLCGGARLDRGEVGRIAELNVQTDSAPDREAFVRSLAKLWQD